MEDFDLDQLTEDAPQHAPELWLITFSDLLSLLLGCFVMMLAMSSVNKSKFDDMANALNKSLESNSAVSISKEANQVGQVRQQIEEVIKANKMDKDVQLKSTADGLVIVLNEAILFPSGGAEVADNNSLITNIGKHLGELPNYRKITVEGHTDDVPIHSVHFRSNWELSAARALSVLGILQDSGIPGSKLNFQGFGEYAPEAPNRDEKGNPIEGNRKKNRRVVIRII